MTARPETDPLSVPLTQKGAANGVATLDANGQVPVTQIPGGVELQCTEITTNPGQMFTGSGDTSFRDLAGWTLPALAAQTRPFVLRLVLNNFQLASAALSVTFQVVATTTTTGTAASDGVNAWIDRLLFTNAAFAEYSLTFERRIAAGTALPALKVRYKGGSNVNNGASFPTAPSGEATIARIEQIAR